MGGKNRDIMQGITVKRLGIILLFLCILLVTGIFFLILRQTNAVKRHEVAQVETEKNIFFRFPFVSPSELDEWKEKALAANRSVYSIVDEDGRKCLQGYSEHSASTLYFRKQLSFVQDPYISWEWKVSKFPLRKNRETLSKKEEFDFAAQVYVVFHANFFLNAKAIQYVWTEDIPLGEVATSPYTKNVKLLVLQSGSDGLWKKEYRDIRDDFKMLFGEELKTDIEGISIMTDSDSTGSSALAFFSDIELGVVSTKLTKGHSEEDSIFSAFKGAFGKTPFIDNFLRKGILLIEKGKNFFYSLIERYAKKGVEPSNI